MHSGRLICTAGGKIRGAILPSDPPLSLGGGGEGPRDSVYGRGGDAVVSLRGVNFGFWSHLGCSGQNAIIFSREGLVCSRVAREKI